MTDPSFSELIETVDVALRSYFLTPARETWLINHDGFHEFIRGLMFSKAPCPNGVAKRALKFFPRRAVLLPAEIFNAVLLAHQFPTMETGSSDPYP